ncbi:hypothetical protein OHV05_11735 [Kitasatospora sp. NBC_00070]|uniref:hypothetical protein n=1 Tax=Kitasatospora sp. NBC_00070 TaxID=2975962 RepID=UPI003248238D
MRSRSHTHSRRLKSVLPALLLALSLAAPGVAVAEGGEGHPPANAEEAKVCSDLLGWAQALVGLPATSVESTCTVK